MSEQQIQNPICKSIFKSGKNITKDHFTKIWIELINKLEKSKSVSQKL